MKNDNNTGPSPEAPPISVLLGTVGSSNNNHNNNNNNSNRRLPSRFSLLRRSSSKAVNKIADTMAQTKMDKPEPISRPRRMSLLETLNDMAKLEGEITESTSRRKSMPTFTNQVGYYKWRNIASNYDDSSGDESDFDSDDEAFDQNRESGATAAADDPRSLLFDNDGRFKCVDDFITLTTDADEGAESRRRPGIAASSPRRRRSLVDDLAAFAESTRSLAGLDNEILPTRK